MRGIEDLLGDAELNAIYKAHKIENPGVRAGELDRFRYPTGIAEYDSALNGGFVTPGVHMLYGEPSGGKTYLCLRTIAAVQRTCQLCMKTIGVGCECSAPEPGMCVYYSTEADWDDAWARDVGVDVENLFLVPNTKAEATLDTVLSLIRRRKVALVVIDSLAFLSPQKEAGGSVEDENPGLQARLLGKFFRPLMTAMADSFAAWAQDTVHVRPAFLLLTNHIRFKVGVMFGNPETRPGGMAPMYAAITETRMGKSKPLPPKSPITDRTMLRFKVVKNKSGAPNTEGEIIVFTRSTAGPRGQVDDAKSIFDMAQTAGLVVKEGKKWVVEGLEFAKKADILERLTTDMALKQVLSGKVVLLQRQ